MKQTYSVPFSDGTSVERTADVVKNIAIVKALNHYSGIYWQLDHVPTGKRIALVQGYQDARRLRRDLLALGDWSDTSNVDLVAARAIIVTYSAPRFAAGRYNPRRS